MQRETPFDEVANPYVCDSWPFEPNVLAKRTPQESAMPTFEEETEEEVREAERGLRTLMCTEHPMATGKNLFKLNIKKIIKLSMVLPWCCHVFYHCFIMFLSWFCLYLATMVPSRSFSWRRTNPFRSALRPADEDDPVTARSM